MRILFAALIALSAAPALAASGTQAEQAACKPDVRRFCADVKSGGDDAYKACLQNHMQQLSQSCQQVLMNHKAAQ